MVESLSSTAMPTATTDTVGSSSSYNTTGIIVGVLVILQIVLVLSFCGICLLLRYGKGKDRKLKLALVCLLKCSIMTIFHCE